MNDLSIITNNQALTMSSREIAELTGKRHADVMRDIRNMLDEIHSTQNCVQYKDSTGRSLPMLMLNKEETLCLVSGYNAKLRMAIINRWQELERDSYTKSAVQNSNKIDTIDFLQQEVELKERSLRDRMKACTDLKRAIERFKALESQEDSTPLLANVKTQQQIEDEFMLSVINSSKDTDILKIEHNAVRRKNNPFQSYKGRGIAREMLRKSVSRLIDSGAISSKQAGIQSH